MHLLILRCASRHPKQVRLCVPLFANISTAGTQQSSDKYAAGSCASVAFIYIPLTPLHLGTYSLRWYCKNFSLIALSRERCCKVLRARLVVSCTPQPADKKLYAKWGNCLFSVVALVQVDGLNVSATENQLQAAWHDRCVWLSCRTQQAGRHRTESRSFFKDFEAFHKKVHFTA